MSWHRVPLLLALSMGPSASQLSAQEGAPAESTLAQATAGRHVRLRLRSGEDLEIRQPQVTAGLVRGVEGDHAVREVPLGDVQMVWRRSSAARTGAIVGAVAGGIAGAIGGVAATEICIMSCPSVSSTEKVKFGGLGAVAGALVGASVGALIGAPFRQWRLVYQREERVTALVSPGRIGVRMTF